MRIKTCFAFQTLVIKILFFGKEARTDDYLTKTVGKIEAKKTRNQVQSAIFDCERLTNQLVYERKKSTVT